MCLLIKFSGLKLRYSPRLLRDIARKVHSMIEQSIVHLPELVKDIDRPVSIYLVHLSRAPPAEAGNR
jgi:hypothetical protein